MNSSKIYLEHANITVSDLNKSIEFFTTAFPHFKVRGGGEGNRKWIHLGDDVTYLALNEAKLTDQSIINDYDTKGFNHIGFVVEDVKAIADRLMAADYQRNYPKQIQPFRIRDYFLDADGNEYEFVEYLSDKTEERNSYDD
ncbi:MAG: VOC family protein [Chitinophagales bacterium]